MSRERMLAVATRIHASRRMVVALFRFGLSAFLLIIGFAKLLSAYPSDAFLQREYHYLLAWIEVLLGFNCISNAFRLSAWTALLLGAAGVVVSFVERAPCGCMGSLVVLARHEHAMLASSLALIAALLLYYAQPRRELS